MHTDISEVYQTLAAIAEIKKQKMEEYILKDCEEEFAVTNFIKTLSRAENPQFKVDLLVEKEGRRYSIIDYFPLTKDLMWKLRSFLYSIGQHAMYESKNIIHEKVMNSGGLGHFIAKEYKGELFNKVEKYLPPPKSVNLEGEKTSSKDVEDDDLPW